MLVDCPHCRRPVDTTGQSGLVACPLCGGQFELSDFGSLAYRPRGNQAGSKYALVLVISVLGLCSLGIAALVIVQQRDRLVPQALRQNQDQLVCVVSDSGWLESSDSRMAVLGVVLRVRNDGLKQDGLWESEVTLVDERGAEYQSRQYESYPFARPFRILNPSLETEGLIMFPVTAKHRYSLKVQHGNSLVIPLTPRSHFEYKSYGG